MYELPKVQFSEALLIETALRVEMWEAWREAARGLLPRWRNSNVQRALQARQLLMEVGEAASGERSMW